MYKILSLFKPSCIKSSIFKLNSDLTRYIFEFLTLGQLNNVAQVNSYLNRDTKWYLTRLKLVYKLLNLSNQQLYFDVIDDNTNAFEVFNHGFNFFKKFSLKESSESNTLAFECYAFYPNLCDMNDFSIDFDNLDCMKILENEYAEFYVFDKTIYEFNLKFENVKFDIDQYNFNYNYNLSIFYFNLDLFIRQIKDKSDYKYIDLDNDYQVTDLEESCCCNTNFFL